MAVAVAEVENAEADAVRCAVGRDMAQPDGKIGLRFVGRKLELHHRRSDKVERRLERLGASKTSEFASSGRWSRGWSGSPELGIEPAGGKAGRHRRAHANLPGAPGPVSRRPSAARKTCASRRWAMARPAR
jgi:hypothetical protein